MLDLFLSGDIDLNVLNSYSLVASDMLKIHDISISEFSDNLLNASELYSKQTACFDIFNINNYPGTLLNNSSDLRYILIEDLKARKLTALPEPLLELAEQFPKSESFQMLTKADTRKHGVKPKAMNI